MWTTTWCNSNNAQSFSVFPSSSRLKSSFELIMAIANASVCNVRLLQELLSHVFDWCDVNNYSVTNPEFERANLLLLSGGKRLFSLWALVLCCDIAKWNSQMYYIKPMVQLWFTDTVFDLNLNHCYSTFPTQLSSWSLI